MWRRLCAAYGAGFAYVLTIPNGMVPRIRRRRRLCAAYGVGFAYVLTIPSGMVPRIRLRYVCNVLLSRAIRASSCRIYIVRSL